MRLKLQCVAIADIYFHTNVKESTTHPPTYLHPLDAVDPLACKRPLDLIQVCGHVRYAHTVCRLSLLYRLARIVQGICSNVLRL